MINVRIPAMTSRHRQYPAVPRIISPSFPSARAPTAPTPRAMLWGDSILPIQPPSELAPAIHAGLMSRVDATEVWSGPNSTLALVQDPVMKAPIAPTKGANTGYAFENAENFEIE